jgi:NADPH-dependent ferric siderophore reductase
LVDFDPETGRFALDFVLHEHGPAARWAAQAEAGQVLRVAGPLGRGRVEQQHQRYFLAGDLTALPAIRQWLIALPATVAVQAHIWSPSSLEHQELPTAEGWNVAWHYGTEGNWADLAERGELAPPGWHPDQPDVKFFIAGEAGLVTRARRAIAMAGRPLPGNLHAAGYWRSGGTGDPAALERLR